MICGLMAAQQGDRQNSTAGIMIEDTSLAAQALLAVDPGDLVTIATDNVGHFGRFVDAKVWTAIQP